MTYAERPLGSFVGDLAAKATMPAGASAAALAGAEGAALLSLACRLTIPGRRPHTAPERLAAVLEQTEAIRTELLALVDEDIAAFNVLVAAFRVPNRSVEENDRRDAAIQAGVVRATGVPLRIAALCARVIDLAEPLAGFGSARLLREAGTGMLLAEAGMRAALLIVTANLRSINDPSRVAHFAEQIRALTAGRSASGAKLIARARKS